jgi:hypothetical protein
MANWKISTLPPTALSLETDLFEKTDGVSGISERVTALQLATLLGVDPLPVNNPYLTMATYSLTGANAQSMLELSGTWNTSGVPTAIKLTITDTLSNAASLLMDLRVGAASMFNVKKNGSVIIANAVLVNTGAASVSINQVASSSLDLTSTGFLNWSPGAVITNGDVWLARDTAGALAQRNAANAQTFSIYATFTNASNYERLSFGASGSGHSIISQAAGTGTVRALVLDPGTSDIRWGKALVALGGGAAPTVGTIGGSGPATAAQNSWLRLQDSAGNACWVPIWK